MSGFLGAAVCYGGEINGWDYEEGRIALQSSIQFLTDIFKKNHSKPALIFGDKVYTYQWLVDRIAFWEDDLREKGISCGDIVAVSGDYSPDICALALAIVSVNAVFMPFASVIGEEKKALLKVGNAGFEFVFKDGICSEFLNFETKVSNPLLISFLERGLPGLVVFSSGSTGFPKGILHDFSRILDKFRVNRKAFVTLTFLQLDHLGGINTLLYTLSNGGTIVSVQDRSPQVICQAIHRHKIELLPVTPSFLNLLIVSSEYQKYDLSSLKVISYGTEVMPESTLAKVKAIFPGIQLQQTYGLSELGVLRTKSRDDGTLWV
ncbi:MAG: AMP-binding protein, partial [Proteobacteria bacterium]|nr:AMP-binding protein [Pseudomonadota bacterium]